MVKGRLLSFIAKPDAIHDDCERAAILIAPMDIRQPCPAPRIVLDRGMLWERGSASIQLSDARLDLRTATERRGIRPWAPARKRREIIPPEVEPPAANEASLPEMQDELDGTGNRVLKDPSEH